MYDSLKSETICRVLSSWLSVASCQQITQFRSVTNESCNYYFDHLSRNALSSQVEENHNNNDHNE